jgi:hypothetical protein
MGRFQIASRKQGSSASYRLPRSDASIGAGSEYALAVCTEADVEHLSPMVHRRLLVASVRIPNGGRMVGAGGG